MTVNAEQGNTVLRLWLLLPRVGDALAASQDLVFSKYGITTEQWRVLSCIKSRGPLRPIDLGSMLERSPNSMSMIVDRMVKAGLVRRTRDRKDRRAVFVSMTDKGREAIGPAVPAGWEFIQKVVSPLSHDERHAVVSTLEKIRCELTSYLNPEMDKAEIIKKSLTTDPGAYKRMVKNLLPPGYDAKRRLDKTKIIRSGRQK